MSFSTRLKAIALMRISRLKAYIYSKRLRKPTNNSASGGARQACQAPVDLEQASPVSELQVGPAFAPYDQDGLFSIHNHEFMADPDFIRAYARGVKAVGGVDYQWHWRVHVGLWAAANAAKRPGDFVECGVNSWLSKLIHDGAAGLGQNRTDFLSVWIHFAALMSVTCRMPKRRWAF